MFVHHHAALALCLMTSSASAFQVPLPSQSITSVSSTELMAKSRKANRKTEQKISQSRPNKFFEAIEDAQGKEIPFEDNPKKKKKNKKDKKNKKKDEPPPQQLSEAEQKIQERPLVSTSIIDEETGMVIVQQGQKVMDVVTRKAVKLSDLGPEYRLAQMFPGVPPDVREKYRFDWPNIEVPQMVEELRAACSVKLPGSDERGIPEHPNVASKAIDFILANRDYLGYSMKLTLCRFQLSAMSNGNKEEAEKYEKFFHNFLTLENHISAPFRQIIQDSEARIGPNFGNLDLPSFANGHLYERIANYIVLKGMVAHWETKVVDADFVERTEETPENEMEIIARGDPNRYLPDPPILYTLKECTQVCAMAQQMCVAFTSDAELFADFPPEIAFFEQAMSIKGGTALREYMINDFCPQRGITPEGLREGMRRWYQQMGNMQIDPYADLTMKIHELHRAMAIGTPDCESQRSPYDPYLHTIEGENPAPFQTYTFNHAKLSIVRFLDMKYVSAQERAEAQMTKADLEDQDEGGMQFDLFGMGESNERNLRPEQPAEEEEWVYEVPEERAVGRPHELGWLNMLDKDPSEIVRMGDIPSGRIIMEED